MSFPQNPNLPKPPPKAPPSARPGSLPPARPLPTAPSAMPAPKPAAAMKPAATPVSPAAAPAVKPAAARPLPTVDVKGLPANLGPMVEAICLYDELLSEENAALKAGDAKTVEGLLDRKMAATRLYQDRLRTLLGDAQCTRSLTPDQRSHVISLVKGLEERANENTVLLKANMSAIEQVFEVINTAARKMRRQEVNYSRAGMVCDNYNRNGVSLAYNHTI